MGCTTSKHPSNRDSWNAPLSRSMSVPTNGVKVEGESFSKISWKSRVYSMPKSEATRTKSFGKLKPVKEEEVGTDHDEAVDLEDGFNGARAPKGRSLGRSASVQPSQGGFRFSGGCKSFKEDGFGRERAGYVEQTSTSVTKLTSNSASPFRSFSFRESLNKSSGLRVLLSPVSPLSPTFTSPARGAALSKSLSSNGRFNLRHDNKGSFPRTLDIPGGPSIGDDTSSQPEWMTITSDLIESGSPLFDPSILATFEKAVEALSDDSWQSSDVRSSSSSSENTSSSPETCSDVDSPDLSRGSTESSEMTRSRVSREGRSCKGVGNTSQRIADAVYSRKYSFSKVSPLDNYEREWYKENYPDTFEMKCPPGCEDKVVLYFTSLRGVRKTFEDCCALRLILKGLRVHVDERDVWMHSKFRQELTDVMGVALSVPRLFIKGRYIGGAEEVLQLHEDGILAKLLDGLPTEWRDECHVCGGVRFIPCTTCGGSCKMISWDDKKSRCPDCNENGLILCPSCD